MDLGKVLQDQLGQVLGASDDESTTATSTSKTTKTSQTTDSSGGIVDSVVDTVDAALKSKLPKGAMTDMATGALDQNNDGHIVDDVLRAGENLLNKKK